MTNACNKGSSSNPVCLTNETDIKERVESESNNVKAYDPRTNSVPVTTVSDFRHPYWWTRMPLLEKEST